MAVFWFHLYCFRCAALICPDIVRPAQADCFHHLPSSSVSYFASQLSCHQLCSAVCIFISVLQAEQDRLKFVVQQQLDLSAAAFTSALFSIISCNCLLNGLKCAVSFCKLCI